MKVLLTFTGFHDPFSPDPVAGDEQEGPILSLIRAHPVDHVVLFSTRATTHESAATSETIRERHPNVSVETKDLALGDPTDYMEILTALRIECNRICESRGAASYFIGTASGTPQMHACWVLLAASGEVPARLLHVRPRRFVTVDRPEVTEVDLSCPEFPTIRSRLWSGIPGEEGERLDASSVIEQLGMVGGHPSFVQALERSSLLASTNIPVLILGESGTGKERIARLIHQLSDRRAREFVPVNCAAIPESLAESTLFGHRRGAFTGANRDQEGKFKRGDGGTLFLDEVGDLSPEVQAKLLRVTQEGVIEPLGGPAVLVDVRLVAATNRDLREAVAKGHFREDLYYRLSVGEVRLPALRERRSDITKLAVHFLDQINQSRKKMRRFTPESLAALQSYDWPGNVRELQSVVETAVVFARGEEIKPEHLELRNRAGSRPFGALPEPQEGFVLEEFLGDARRRLILKALEKARGNQSEAARLLGITPQAVHKFLQKEQNDFS